MRASEVAKLLSAQVEGVVRELLPQGRRVGHEWKCGGTTGEPGQSLGVHLTGEKAGVWADFSTGERGDLIGLWIATRNVTLLEACREALAYLGIREDQPAPVAKAWKRPTRDGVTGLTDEHARWLREVRKLPDESVSAYKLKSRGDRLMFPYLVGNDLIFAKYRRLPKTFSADAECEPILFGWQAIRSDARAVCITEGELDAIAMHAYGFPSLSVPTGAGGLAWVDREFDRLARFDTIYLALDTDEKGQGAIPKLVERLGRERTLVVQLPGKDANDCLVRDVPRGEIINAMRAARSMDPAELRNVGDFEDAMFSEYSRVDEGLVLPWKKTHDDILLRAGETSIWAGVNGHGKSAVVSNVLGYQAVRGTTWCVASMEFRTPLWLMRMNRQVAGTAFPPEAFARHVHRELAKVMYAFDVAGRTKAKRILEVFRYARRRYQTELFAIDNLTKCGFADDDYSGQKAFVEELTDFARETQTHVMIVAHMRKGESEDRPAGKMAVKGSGGITDMADTLIEVWRNKPREKALRIALETKTPVDEKFEKQADTLLLVTKQRATGKEPVINLWFDKASTQFLSAPHYQPRSMVDYSVVRVPPATLDHFNTHEARS
jgi:twinkle protein